jgi:hypothetical protein
MKDELIEYKLIDWVLFNIELIKKLLKEMKYTGAATVYSDASNLEIVTDKMEKNIVYVDESLEMMAVIENAIQEACKDDELFVVVTELYFENKSMPEVAIKLKVTERQVKYRKRQIQNIVRKYLYDADKEINFIASLMSALKIKPKSTKAS